MAKGLYIGNNSAKKVKKIYLGDNNSRKVKKGYVGVDGVAKLFYSSGFRWQKYRVIMGNGEYSSKTTIKSLGYTSGQGAVYVSVSKSTGLGRKYIQSFVDVSTYLKDVYIDSSGTLRYQSGSEWFDSGYAECEGSRGDAYQAIVVSKFTTTPRTLAEFASIDSDSESNTRYINGSSSGSGRVYMLTIDHNGSSSPYWRYAIYQLQFSTHYDKGEYIGDVESEQRNSYPDNGRHSDGYWYVYQGEA